MPLREKEAIRCAVRGETLAAHAVLWLVAHPAGGWVADAGGKLPGARLALTCDAETLRRAAAAKNLDSAETDMLLAQAEQQLTREALQWLSLAHKAGRLLSGFDTVGKALRNEELALLIHAGDASEDGIRKFAGIARSQGLPPAIRHFDQRTLSALMGREGGIVHLGLRPGGMTKSFLRSCQRLAGFSRPHGL